MINVAIVKTKNCFLPEAVAYKKQIDLEEDMHSDIINFNQLNSDFYDASILFYGLRPFWKKYPPVIIGEYNSLSIGKFSKVKDILKRLLNIRPNHYMALNEKIVDHLHLPSSEGVTIRPMGYPEALVEKVSEYEKKHDVVYSGTLRAGTTEAILKLAAIGLNIAVIGDTGNHRSLFGIENITLYGRQPQERALEIMATARWGLNITPDIWPLNIQDCTKVIEYSALKIGTITNRYAWINQFEKDRQGRFLDIDSVSTKEAVINFNFKIPNVSDLTWESIIKSSGLIEIIKTKVEKSAKTSKSE